MCCLCVLFKVCWFVCVVCCFISWWLVFDVYRLLFCACEVYLLFVVCCLLSFGVCVVMCLLLVVRCVLFVVRLA